MDPDCILKLYKNLHRCSEISPEIMLALFEQLKKAQEKEQEVREKEEEEEEKDDKEDEEDEEEEEEEEDEEDEEEEEEEEEEQNEQEQEQDKQEQKEILEACRGLIQDMWIIFWFLLLKNIEKYHYSIKIGWDTSGYERQQDVKTKFLQIHQLLLDKWLHPFPPFGQLLLSESKLVSQMIYSEKYFYNCHIDDAISEPEYGFVSPPELENTNLSYTISSYIDYRMAHHYHHDIRLYGNKLLINLLSSKRDEKNICTLTLNKYGSKTYRELYETSALKNYINFEPSSPNLEFEHSYKLRDLFNYEWNGSDSEENSDCKENDDDSDEN